MRSGWPGRTGSPVLKKHSRLFMFAAAGMLLICSCTEDIPLFDEPDEGRWIPLPGNKAYFGSGNFISATAPDGKIFLSKNLYIEEDGSGRILMTSDKGVSWDVGGRGLVRNRSINAFAFLSDGTVLAGVSSAGVFRSRDKGISWEQMNNRLTDIRVRDLVVDSQDVVYLSGSYKRIFYSVDGCGSWTGRTIEGESWNAFSLQCDRGRDLVYAITDYYGFHCLSDTLNTSKWIPYPMTLGYVRSTGIDSEGYLYIAGYRSILVYHPSGGWYFEILDDSFDDSIDFIYVGSSDRVFVSTREGRLFVSPGRGAPWDEVDLPALGGRRLDNIFESDGCLFILGWNSYTLYRSCDGEQSWEIVGLSDRRFAGPMVRSNGDVLVHTFSSIISWEPGDELWGLKSWRDDYCQYYSDIRGKLLDEHEGGYILSGICGLKASWDGGCGWNSVFGPDTVVNSIEIADDGMVYVATDRGLLRSTDGLGAFESVIEGEISPYALVAGDDGVLFVGTGEGLLRTMDRGDSWEAVVDTSYVNTVAFDSLGNVYAGIDGCVLFSTDWGENWEKIYFGGFNESPKTLIGSPCGRVIALTNHRKIYLLESGDRDWKMLSSSLPMHADFTMGDDGYIYIYDYEIFRYSIPLPEIQL